MLITGHSHQPALSKPIFLLQISATLSGAASGARIMECFLWIISTKRGKQQLIFKITIMGFIKTKESIIGKDVDIYYEDLGDGTPVVFIHGWPLNVQMWEYQVTELVKNGLRCICYDRRGFGSSSRPLGGYDYDTMADDLKALLEALNLQNVILVGFSMGGGEVARYFGRHGGARVAKAVLISAVTPYMAKNDHNPDGVDQSVFDDMMSQMKEDRIAFLDAFGKQFFGVSMVSHPASAALMDYYRTLGALASPIATQKCAVAFSQTDFRNDLQSIKVPTLIIHGDADKVVPIEASGNRTAEMIPTCRYLVYEGEPHGLFYTAKEQLNQDLLDFIKQ
jgi:non-heme chloroperoxidase